ncbi:MAG: integrase/recombinase [Acidimicrobiaceae bacterium]|nr:integrase/recombinase [Acidimicrobiaceae bacterium]
MSQNLDVDKLHEHLVGIGLSNRSVALYLATARRVDRVAETIGVDLLELGPLEARRLSEAWPEGRSNRAQLRATVKHVLDAHELPGGPLRAMRVPKHPPARCRALSETDARLLAAAARARRDRAGLATLFGLYGALRRAEIARVRTTDIQNGWLHVYGKGDKEREIPLHPIVLEAIEVQDPSISTTWIFPGRFGRHCSPATIWAWIGDLADSCGLAVTPHELRHTCLATANDRTGDLRSTQAFAGHSKPETTALYTRATGRRLRALVEAIDYDVDEGA